MFVIGCRVPAAAACAAALGASLLASSGAALQQDSPAPQRPTFRTAVNFVRVDVYPRADGRPVPELRAEDFAVEEDGVAQTISTFEHIVIRDGTAPETRADPRNVRESNQMAGDPRNRLFVLFLDTFHVTDSAAWHNGRSRQPGNTAARLPAEARMGPPTNIDRALGRFLRASIGPDDLIAAMTPEMDPAALTFIRRPESIEAFLGTTWARRFSSDNLDPVEERYFVCYPPDDPQHRFDGVAVEMVARKREAQTIQSLRGLAQRLGELREERKGVVIVSEGWALVRPNQDLARPFKNIGPPQPPGIHVGAGGKLAAGTDPRTYVTADWQQCETDRVRLANLDHRRDYLDVLNEANRANLSFYPIDPRGLAVFDQPLDYQPAAAPRGTDEAQVGRVSGVVEDFERLRGRLETLETAASATDGLAMIKSNDLTASLNRVVADLSDYYLIGYASTNAKADGSFRRISVRVKHPGVEVRARRGYRAATAAEVAARAAAAARPDPAAVTRARTLASLDRMRADRPVRVAGGLAWASAPDEAGRSRPVLWVVAELDGAAARTPDWTAGGKAVLTVVTPGGQALFDEDAAVSPASRSFLRHLADSSMTPGEYVVRVRVRGAERATADLLDQVRIAVPVSGPAAEAPPGDPVVFRSGPFTGRAFLPTADPRFRRSERLRVDTAVAGPAPTVSARLLDRNGQPLPLPVATSVREEAYLRIASAELALAPLGPGDYLVELIVQRGPRSDTVLLAFRIVP
ncbi:MAG: VWA domain-containing protein [Vicinamibacterales bacterium]